MTHIDLEAQPTDPPELAVVAANLYFSGGRKLDDGALAEMTDVLDKNRGDNNALFWSLAGLEVMCQRMAKGGDNATADRISHFIRAQRDRYPELEAEALALSQDRAGLTLERTQRATGSAKAVLAAPIFGATVPKGTVRLSDMVSHDRLAPVRRKKS